MTALVLAIGLLSSLCCRNQDRYINALDGLTYVRIEPGKFQMGCPPGEERTRTEARAVPVTLTRAFWLAESEVTQSAFRKVMGTNPSYFRGDDLPVEQVTWEEAEDYCGRVGGRLPTEAEWEFAARGRIPAGRYGAVEDVAWYGQNSARRSHSVKGKRANQYGLFDMLGNVAEWNSSWYSGKDVSGGINPEGPLTGPGRSLRGGAWDYPAGAVLNWPPGWAATSDRLSTVGFRCALDRE